MKPILTDARVFNVCMEANTGIPSPDYPYMFNGITVTENGAWTMGHYSLFTELFPEVKTVAHINPDYIAYSWFPAAKAAAEAYGMTVVAQKGYPTGTVDFYPILSPIIAQHPDSIDFLSSTPGDIALMIKQARELGYKGILMSPNAAPMDLLTSITGMNYAEGYIMNQPDFLSPLLPEGVHELYRDFSARFPDSAEGIQNTTLSGYASVMLYKRGIERAGSIDTDMVKAVFDDPTFTMEFPGFGEKGFFGCETYGICRLFPWFTLISQIQDGELVTLGWKWQDVP